jgi:hypothetical protein
LKGLKPGSPTSTGLYLIYFNKDYKNRKSIGTPFKSVYQQTGRKDFKILFFISEEPLRATLERVMLSQEFLSSLMCYSDVLSSPELSYSSYWIVPYHESQKVENVIHNTLKNGGEEYQYTDDGKGEMERLYCLWCTLLIGIIVQSAGTSQCL